MSNATDEAWLETKAHELHQGLELKHSEQERLIEIAQGLFKTHHIQGKLVIDMAEEMDELKNKRSKFNPKTRRWEQDKEQILLAALVKLMNNRKTTIQMVGIIRDAIKEYRGD